MATRKVTSPPEASDRVQRLEEHIATSIKGFIRRRLLWEWVKGTAALILAIAGALILKWGSESSGLQFWAGVVPGLTMLAVGMAYTVEFSKEVINGELIKATIPTVREIKIAEWVKAFLAFFSIGAGISFLAVPSFSYYFPEGVGWWLGLILISAGVTFLWRKSKLHRR